MGVQWEFNRNPMGIQWEFNGNLMGIQCPADPMPVAQWAIGVNENSI